MLTKPDDVFSLLETTLNASKVANGINSVLFGDQMRQLGSLFPSVWIVPGTLDREPMASGLEVLLRFRASIFVLHADMTTTRAIRTHQDLQLADLVGSSLGYGLSGNLAGSWIETEVPRNFPVRQGKMVISTELRWMGLSRGRLT